MSVVAQVPSPGSVIAQGRFELGDKLGEGGMSVVHLATQRSDKRTLAVKLLIDRYKGRPEREQRLLDEGKYLEQLGRSPNIVELVEHGRLDEFGGWPFVATELMTGSPLSRFILRERELPLARLADVSWQLAVAIQHVHRRGIVHRDITTNNVFVCEDERQADLVKLFDFSHAGRLDGPRVARGGKGRLTGEFDVPGTHGYMSPEQARAEPVTTAMDVFAFGAVLFEMVTRSPLFDVRNREQYIELAKRDGLEVPQLQAWAYEIPEALADLVNACTKLQPDARPSIDSVVEQLADIRASASGSQLLEASEEFEPVEEPAARERARVWPWVVVGVLVLVGVGVWAWSQRERPEPSVGEPAVVVPSEPPPAPEPKRVEPEPPEPIEPAELPKPAEPAEPKPPEPKLPKPPEPKPPKQPKQVDAVEPTLAKHETPDCKQTRDAAKQAVADRKWAVVLDKTKQTSCWAKSVEPLRLRVEALAQTKAFGKCIDAGASSKDPKVVEWVDFCRNRVDR